MCSMRHGKTLVLVLSFVLGTIIAEYTQAERFLPSSVEAQFREAVPQLNDAGLSERIDNPEQTFFYTSKRFWQKEYTYGGYPYRYTYINRGRFGAARRTTTTQWRGRRSGVAFQELAKEITDVQWQNAGGLAAEHDIKEVKFISFPKVDGKLVPIVARGTSITYPNGTIFGGILCRNDEAHPVEFRLRKKVEGKWVSKTYLPNGSSFAYVNESTSSCNACHEDAGTFVKSEKHNWSGVIGADRNYSFGEWASNVRKPGSLSDGTLSKNMLNLGLLERYDPKKHTFVAYGKVETKQTKEVSVAVQ